MRPIYDNLSQLSINLREAQWNELKVLAAAGERSVASVIREMLAKSIAEQKPQKPEA